LAIAGKDESINELPADRGMTRDRDSIAAEAPSESADERSVGWARARPDQAVEKRRGIAANNGSVLSTG
jgi:hypothetical protein